MYPYVSSPPGGFKVRKGQSQGMGVYSALPGSQKLKSRFRRTDGRLDRG
jgi:hypothetical protein